jgi:TrmH family RNA methyltransferase
MPVEMGKSRTRNANNIARLRLVQGRHNPLIKDLRRAFVRGDVTDDGFCALEGLRILEEAIRSGVRFRAVFFSESAHAKAQRLLSQIGSRVDTLLLPDKLFSSVVPSDTPQGVAALVRWPQFSLDDVLAKASFGPLLVAVGVQDPGNLGTIMRSAEAFGVGGLILGEGTVSPFNPKVVRASAGSIFRLPILRTKIADILDRLRGSGLRLLATSSHKGTPLQKARLHLPLAIFIGGEGAGLTREFLTEMDEVIAISHSPKVESLNAGVAASIVLYEIARDADQRRVSENLHEPVPLNPES